MKEGRKGIRAKNEHGENRSRTRSQQRVGAKAKKSVMKFLAIRLPYEVYTYEGENKRGDAFE